MKGERSEFRARKEGGSANFFCGTSFISCAELERCSAKILTAFFLPKILAAMQRKNFESVPAFWKNHGFLGVSVFGVLKVLATRNLLERVSSMMERVGLRVKSYYDAHPKMEEPLDTPRRWRSRSTPPEDGGAARHPSKMEEPLDTPPANELPPPAPFGGPTPIPPQSFRAPQSLRFRPHHRIRDPVR